MAIGSTEFLAKLRKQVLKQKGEYTNERDWRRLLPFSEVVAAVERVRNEPWDDFVNRYGDWGRDLALYIGRLRCGLTLKELGGTAGMNIRAVSQDAMRIRERLKREQELSAAYRKVLKTIEESR